MFKKPAVSFLAVLTTLHKNGKIGLTPIGQLPFMAPNLNSYDSTS